MDAVPQKPDPSSSTGGRRFALWLSWVYGAVFGLGGISLPFFPVWLKAAGIDLAWIGIITALPSLTRFTVLPFVTALAERRQVLHRAIAVCAGLTALGFVGVGLGGSLWPILVLYGLTACVWTPIVPLVDGYALKGVAQFGLAYGPLRLWGSAAFIIGAFACGLLIDVFAPVHLIWVMVGMALFGALASLQLQPLRRVAPGVVAEVVPAHLLRQAGFLAIIVSAALIQGSHAAYYAYSSIIWQTQGYSGLAVSGLWSLGVVAEIVLFAVSPRFRWSPQILMALGALGGVLRWSLTAQQLPLPLLAAVQLMHGCTYGLTQIGTVGLLLRQVPGHLLATGQGYLVALSGAVLGLAYMMAGQLFAAIGDDAYYAMALMAGIGGVVILLARPWLAAQPQSAASGA
jgi:PPP family 3-phenylpropionic acid transporter